MFLFFLVPILLSVAFGVLRALIAGPKPIFQQELKNKTISTSSFGKPWPRCRGKVRLPGNMIWSTPIRQANRKTVSGGIFGLGQQSVYTYTYSISCAVGFGYKLGGGQAGSYLTIYADGKELYTAQVTDATESGLVTLASDGTSATLGEGQNVSVAALGDQNITIQTGPGGNIKLSLGDMIQITYYTVISQDGDTEKIQWNSAPGLDGGTFQSLGLSLEMSTQEYQVQTPITLTPNQSGVIGIYPSLIADYPAGGTVSIVGLNAPLLDNSSFDPDPHDGSHPAAGGYYPKQGYVTLYYGSTTQNPDPLIVTAMGVGKVPAYRGLAYIVISDLELANYGNRIPNFSAIIDWESPQGLPDSTAGEILGVRMTSFGTTPYQHPPNVVFSGDGTGAKGNAVLGGPGYVLDVEMTDYGTGYSTASVSFLATDGIGSGAAGTPIIGAGAPQQPPATVSVALSDVVSSVMTEAGYSVAQYDVSALATTTMLGIELDQEAYKDSLQRLMGLYLFDSAEVDGQIIFRFRDGLPVIEIPEADLGVLADMSANEPRIVESLEDEQSVPYFVWIRYYDSLKLYQQAAQYDKRISQPYASTELDALPVTNSRYQVTLDVPVTEIGATMKQQAQKILYDFWSSRFTIKFKLPYTYLQLDPTDIVEIPYKDDFLVVRFTSINCGASLALECEGVSHDYHQSVALSDSGKGSGGSPNPPDAGNDGPSTLFLLDIPFLEDADSHDLEDTGLYFALGAQLNLAASNNTLSVDWHGGKVYRSVDTTPADFASVGSTSTPAFNGLATTLLPAPTTPWVFDNSNTLTVSWSGYNADFKIGPSSPLMSSTDDGVTTNHENLAALIKSNGEVELFQFVNVVNNGDGTFTLSRLVRGVRGTETMAKGHSIGDVFVLLNGVSGLQDSVHFDIPLGDRNLVRYYQAVSDGAKADFSSPATETTICRDLMPYAPYKITQYVDPLGNLIISWTRRTRVGGNWVDGTNGPISEQYEQYEVDINGPGQTVVRTIATPLPTTIYTQAQQIADFGAAVAQVSCTVYQISAVVGRGFPGTNTVSPSEPTWGSEPYAISFDLGDGATPTANQKLLEHLIPGNVAGVIFPVGLNDSVAGCRVAPTKDYTVTINWKESPLAAPSQIGTLVYRAGSLIGTFTLGFTIGARDFPVSSGQVVEFLGGPADGSIAGIYWTVSGKRFTGQPATTGTRIS